MGYGMGGDYGKSNMAFAVFLILVLLVFAGSWY